MIDERKLRAKLIENGVTVAELSKAIGINEVTYYRKVNGLSDFYRNELSIIKSVLGLSSNEFENIFFAQ